MMFCPALVGRFTIVGREDRPAIVERYDMSSVEKVGGDHWRFNARIRYGSVDSRREDRDIVEVLPLV